MLLLGATGCNARIRSPEWLWAELIVVALAALLTKAARARAARLAALVAPKLQTRLIGGLAPGRRQLKVCLQLFALATGIFSLCGLQYGFAWEEVHQRGIDIVVALDVSDSMLVHDGESHTALSRLSLAKRKVTDLLQMLDGDRVALVAFAGAAFVECPLTLDYGAAALFLESLDTNVIPVKGTALDQALSTSLRVLEHSGRDARAIILITDGEDHSGGALRAAQDAKAQGVRIYPIGIGRDEGAPIPLPEGGFRRDAQGKLVLSHLDEATLKQVAQVTQGTYVRTMTGDVDIKTIYTAGIRKELDVQDLGVRRKQHWQERFQWPLMLALVALAIESLLPETPKTARRLGRV
jgi:Ca-activated chloride channel family protein